MGGGMVGWFAKPFTYVRVGWCCSWVVTIARANTKYKENRKVNSKIMMCKGIIKVSIQL